MNGSLQGAWKIGTVMGIPIRVHFTWFIVFGLITWSLSTLYFPKAAPDLPVTSYWLKGALAALLLFASVAFHELAHCIVAKRYKISIESITLFIFGGVSRMKSEPPHPRAEFNIAIAGPLSSFFLYALFYFISMGVSGSMKTLFIYLAQINLIIGIFNLIPGFPLDGGRVLRAILWSKNKNFFSATQKASGVGRKIALFFVFFGLFSLFTGVPGGLWLMLIGWFLFTAAQASYQQSALQEYLFGVKVKDLMVRDLINVSPSLSLEEVVNNYFLKYGYGGFPVVEDGKYLGIITLKEIKGIPKNAFEDTRVREVYLKHKKQWEISAEAEAIKALESMLREDTGRLVVKKGASIQGLITRNGIARYVQIIGK
ncbi:site-2 protease family protein [uncultured Candidatus Kuenenia sp.]|jgi:Zn-dependent protease/predicted transcriptional regulator|uniref:site-2 protease family protein n=1 Tax=uncultured Candidatus Kuenenia sp. TaxID=1048336 RepID=UPI0002E18D31|nr:site-2 protease family protein [uncultured Candidatus Kuenenia sp.]